VSDTNGSVDEAATALYRVAPEEFVAARDARVKALRADGDAAAAKQVAALRKPTVSAWLVNLLVADDPDLAAQVGELADQLRAAQEQLSGAELRALGVQRQQLVSGLVTRARRLASEAGRPAGGGAVESEVESTLRAALADPDVAAEVLSGRLTHPAEVSGFGGAGGGAAAPRTTPARPAPRRGAAKTSAGTRNSPATKQSAAERRRAEQRERAEQAVQEAREAETEAQHELDEAESALAAAADGLASAKEELAEAARRHAEAQRAADEAAEAEEQARWRRKRAAAALKAAQASVGRAEERAVRLDR